MITWQEHTGKTTKILMYGSNGIDNKKFKIEFESGKHVVYAKIKSSLTVIDKVNGLNEAKQICENYLRKS